MAPSTSGILATHWLLTLIAGALIASRLFLRLKIQHQSLLFSDGLLVVAWCGSLSHSALATVLAARGALDPANDYTLLNWDVAASELQHAAKEAYQRSLMVAHNPPETNAYFSQIIWASAFPFFTALYFCKFALLATYHQLFPAFMKALRWTLYGTTVYCVCGYLATVCVQLFLCWPIEGNWAVASNRNAVCSSAIAQRAFIIAWALHFSGNIIIAILPFFILRGLQMNKRVKIGVVVIFLLGFIDIAFSLTRFITIIREPMSFKPLTLIQLWTALDENIALITACLPALRPYLRVGFKNSTAEVSHDNGVYHTPRTPRTPVAMGFDKIGGSDRGLAGRGETDSEDDAWSYGKKSNRSDIELVQAKAMHSPTMGVDVGPGEIRVEREFRVVQATEYDN